MLAHIALRCLPCSVTRCAAHAAGGAAAAAAASSPAAALQHQASTSTSTTSTTAPATPTLTRAHLHSKERVLEVGFSDGVVHRFSAELLRVASPSADNAGSPWRGSAALGGALLPPAPATAAATTPARGRPRVVAGRRRVGLMAVEPVGRYALRLKFDDLHDAIYPYGLLRDLGARRLAVARRYLRLLRDAGLSRDPPPRASRK